MSHENCRCIARFGYSAIAGGRARLEYGSQIRCVEKTFSLGGSSPVAPAANVLMMRVKPRCLLRITHGS